jgi:5'-nucleotidase
MKLNGVTLNPSGTYRVTTNAFLAAVPNGGDNFFTLGKGTDRKTTGDNDLTMLVNYLAANSPVTADTVFRSAPCKADSTAPTGTFTVAPTAVWAGQTVTVTVTATDDVTPAADIKKVVNWGDGTTDSSATHVYPAAGTFTPTVTLTDQAGKQMTFEVYDKQIYPIESAPLQTIFGPSNEPHLNLITCGGTFNRASQIYNKRLVVFQDLTWALINSSGFLFNH